jgi:hypothetical protein
MSGLEASRNFEEQVKTDVVNITICSGLLKCTVTEFRTWVALTVLSLYTKSEQYIMGANEQTMKAFTILDYISLK